MVSGIIGISNSARAGQAGPVSRQPSPTATAALSTRSLGPLKVTAIGFGAMNIAGMYGPGVSRPEAIKILRAVHERGVNFLDTAEVYGPFLSEDYVGEAVAAYRNEVVIAT